MVNAQGSADAAAWAAAPGCDPRPTSDVPWSHSGTHPPALQAGWSAAVPRLCHPRHCRVGAVTADLGAAGSRIAGRPDIWEIALIHTTFRREFATLPGLVHGLADAEAAHAAALGDHWQLLRD